MKNSNFLLKVLRLALIYGVLYLFLNILITVLETLVATFIQQPIIVPILTIPIKWFLLFIIVHKATIKFLESIKSLSLEKYYRFYGSIILGICIPTIGLLLGIAIIIIMGETLEIGGGDFMTLVFGYLSARYTAKKKLPDSEINHSRWY